jgi:type VI secretion system secreted protein Hcp
MAFDAFVKIDGIEGESTDDKHAGWIEVLACDAKVSQRVSSTASSVGGASAERADFSDFSFVKELDKASPKLALACAGGTHINTIIIEFCRSGTDKVTFIFGAVVYFIYGCFSLRGSFLRSAECLSKLPHFGLVFLPISKRS